MRGVSKGEGAATPQDLVPLSAYGGAGGPAYAGTQDWSAIIADNVVLEKLRVKVSRAVSPEFAASVNFDIEDEVWGSLVYSLAGHVLGEQLAEQTVPVRFDETAALYFPRSVWQHWKQAHAPAWYVRRWPVLTERHEKRIARTRYVHTKQYATFPASPIRTPEQFRGPVVVRYETTEVSTA